MKSPKLLIQSEIEVLNDKVLNDTGCFSFLLPEKMWEYSEPKTGKEAVEIWSVGLYVIYHDYGCCFIKYVLDPNNLPNQSMKDEVYHCKKHIDAIEKYGRARLAHGVFDSVTEQKFFNYLFPKQLIELDKLSEIEWNRAAERIRDDADLVFDQILQWANEHKSKKNPFLQFCNPRERFATSEYFKESFDVRILLEIYDRDYAVNDGKYARSIIGKENIESVCVSWRQEIVSKYKNEELKGPKEILEYISKKMDELHNPPQRSSIEMAEKRGLSPLSLL